MFEQQDGSHSGGEHAEKPLKPIICFCHLRWDFVYQRPQHLMSRLAQSHRVYFIEEPMRHNGAPEWRRAEHLNGALTVLTPMLPWHEDAEGETARLRTMLDDRIRREEIEQPILWYYTPMMMPFSNHIIASAIVYDCMDELSGFRFAASNLPAMEKALLAKADVVFTGGKSLFEAKNSLHPNVHLFASSVDLRHFSRARTLIDQPPDQRDIVGPRLGFFGVIDERIDLGLIAAVADARPDWSLIMVGPLAKIDPADLPRRANIHYLGAKSYAELPDYLAGWEVALMPFAINDATRFISPTKTPEYLAGGKPVVSTRILDVARSYSNLEGVFIAEDAKGFLAACENALLLPRKGTWLPQADALLADMSWDKTARAMQALIGVDAETSAAQAPAFRPADRRKSFDYLIVGAGFSGSVLAERLARDGGKTVMLIDRRPHIGGNAYDHLDAHGIRVHKYGPHIFHTNSDDIFRYLSHFTLWRPYEHRVLTEVAGKLLPMPINRTTLNRLYGLTMSSEADVAEFLASKAEPVDVVRTAEDAVVASVGRDLYEKFFRGYTRKQWGLDPSQLDKSVTARVPARADDDDRYFTDKHQYMPLKGFTHLFENMIDDDRITTGLGVDFREVDFSYDKLIYCGPIDEYFDHRLGKLPYRSLEFRHETLAMEQFQTVAVVNNPDEQVPHTRITEYKHLTGQKHPNTSISYEYPCSEGDPYYPIPAAKNAALLGAYETLARQEKNVVFAGRLGTYRYYNMDQVVGQALAIYRRLHAASGAMQALAPAAG